MVITVAALNLIQYKIKKLDLFRQNHGYTVGLPLAYTTHLLRNSGLKAKVLIFFWLFATR